MSSGKVLLGVVAGVAAGALLGVLFAPDRGWNTRMRIYKKADDYKESLIEKFSDFLDTISESIGRESEGTSDFGDSSKINSEKV